MRFSYSAVFLLLLGLIDRILCVLPQFGAPPAIPGLAESRQFNFGFGAGPQNGPNNRPFNQFNMPRPQRGPLRPQQQQQQQRPQVQKTPLIGNAGVFQLAVDHFPELQDEVAVDNTLNNTLPGVLSGNVVVHTDPVNKVEIDVTVAPLPPQGSSCRPNKNPDVDGVCSNVFDVVISRRCSKFRTGKSDHCRSNEVCCFKLSTDDAVPDIAFDQVPCGLRRTPELAQRELQRIADEENLDSIPMRILGGLEAFQNEICWQAAILVDGKYVCGGTVINSKHVITAGHCLNDVESVKQVQVLTGARDLKNQGRCAETFAASDIFFNDNYDPRSLVMDMVIIELATPITNTNCTCKICLPDGTEDMEATGKLDCIVTGYGTTKPGMSVSDVGPLNIGNVSVVVDQPNEHRCSERLHLSPQIPKKFLLDESMICAIGDNPVKVTDTCDLDGGSPLVCRMKPDALDIYTLVGLSSWGLPCGSNVVNDPAGREVRIPTVYAHIRPAMKWIDLKTRI
ncbi:putative Ovochymase-2 [Hypsibius exemplaris]|uniref:Ovochymase-2 n=1 Tax=Hypsibius exemplaris TaxID=2072580 RepID=A0A1W0WLI3_HYPEX|nr:putative Ovochymase-2 [Hypsibius exemplaris]